MMSFLGPPTITIEPFAQRAVKTQSITTAKMATSFRIIGAMGTHAIIAEFRATARIGIYTMTSRRPEWISKRKPFPKTVKAAILARSGGMCEMPGCGAVGKEFDHYPIPVAINGPATLENGRLLCRACNSETGVETAQSAAKADRAGGRSGQAKRRKAAQERGTHKAIPQRKNPWPSGRKFQKGK